MNGGREVDRMLTISRALAYGDVAEAGNYLLVRGRASSEDQRKVEVCKRDTGEVIGRIDYEEDGKIYYQENIEECYGISLKTINSNGLVRQDTILKTEESEAWQIESPWCGLYTYINSRITMHINIPSADKSVHTVYRLEKIEGGKTYLCRGGIKGDRITKYDSRFEVEEERRTLFGWSEKNDGIYLVAITPLRDADIGDVYMVYKIAYGEGSIWNALSEPKIVTNAEEYRDAIRGVKEYNSWQSWYRDVKWIRGN
jgi:hypothetical protein